MNRSVSEIIDTIGTEREYLLPVMQEIIRQQHQLSEDSMKTIAERFGISAAEVYGTATFYSFINVAPLGRNIIRVCKSISCDLRGMHEIIAAIEEHLRIKIGQTTADERFTLLQTNCIGWCHDSPAMLINDRVYTGLTPRTAIEALEEWE